MVPFILVLMSVGLALIAVTSFFLVLAIKQLDLNARAGPRRGR